MVEFHQMWFIFQHLVSPGPHTSSIGVAALGFLCYRSSHPRSTKKSSTADMTSSSVWYWLLPSKMFFLCWRTENGKMVPNQENMEKDQPIQKHSHTQQPLQALICVHFPGESGLPSVGSPGRSQNVSSTTFQSPELLIQCGFIWQEIMQLVSGKVEFNACQVLLLWHNNSLVSIWTFQPSLVNECSIPWSQAEVMAYCARGKRGELT